jgi:long-chain acyl-CoA synthetase
VVEGYGLTETAPVVAVRPFNWPVFGTIGTPISCCEVKIVDEAGKTLPVGVKGTVMVRGGNVMKGYYRQPELTARVLGPDGWLDTGDLGYKTIAGELVLRGRKKDTIVLRGGENIEPLPLEMKINESRYVAQSVVVGQDQRYLGALLVVNRDEVLAWAAENSVEEPDFAALLRNQNVRKLFEVELAELINQKNGFKLFERINRFSLLEKPFETGVELSAKQEIMRYKLDELYKKEIACLFE